MRNLELAKRLLDLQQYLEFNNEITLDEVVSAVEKDPESVIEWLVGWVENLTD